MGRAAASAESAKGLQPALWRIAVAVVVALALAGVSAADPAPCGPSAAPAGDYVLDSRGASLVIRLPRLFGALRPTLRLTGLEGGFRYDPAHWQSTKVVITADSRRVDASGGPLSRLAATLIESDRYPTIAFRSESLTADADGRGQLAGQLTFHGVTRPLTLDVALESVSGDSGADVRMKFSGAGRISRSDFGISVGSGLVGDTVGLVFDMDFVSSGNPGRGSACRE